jgi:hypothetical protein
MCNYLEDNLQFPLCKYVLRRPTSSKCPVNIQDTEVSQHPRGKKLLQEIAFRQHPLRIYWGDSLDTESHASIKKTTTESASPVNIKKTTLSQFPEHYIYSIEEIPLSQCFVQMDWENQLWTTIKETVFESVACLNIEETVRSQYPPWVSSLFVKNIE